MSKDKKKEDNKITINTKWFAGKWSRWNEEQAKPDWKTLKSPEDWDAIHAYWNAFVNSMFNDIVHYTNDDGEQINKWMLSDIEFDTDEKIFTETSKRCFTKVRSIQKKIAGRDTNDFKLVYHLDKTGLVSKRVNWDESVLPNEPFGMCCKTKNPPKVGGRSSSTIWEDIEKLTF